MQIPRVDRDKAVGDEWTVDDANDGIRASEAIEEAGRLEHNKDGEHLLPAAEAAAFVRWTGATYVIEWSHNIDGVTRNSAGNVTITLTNTMASPDRVAAFVAPEGEDITGARTVAATQTFVTIEMNDATLTAVDRSFFVEIYGERLNP